MKYPFRNPQLPLEERVKDLISRLTITEKVGFLPTNQQAVNRLGIAKWSVGGEIARGFIDRSGTKPATVFPQPIGMSGMFNPELMGKIGEAAGTECRIYHKQDQTGGLMLWGPTVDLVHDPRWGRNEECYGEDPYLTGQMSIGYTKGLAGNDDKYLRILPTLKHFCANSNEENRGTDSSNLSLRTKHEYYYAAFKPSITEGAAHSVMTAYNELSGVPAMLNPDLKPIVKDEWGLDFVVTDGGDFSQTVIDHKYCKTHAETLALAIKAGTDVMCDNVALVVESALEALKQGFLTENEIDTAISNSISGRFKLGEFDPQEQVPYANVDIGLLDCEKHREINQQAALEQVVLLKNNGLLPLEKKKINKIAVIGEVGGRNVADWYCGTSNYDITVYEGLKAALGEKKAVFDNGNDHIAIRSNENGKFLSVGTNGEVSATAKSVDSKSTFIKSDWDNGEITLTSLENGNYFTAETLGATSTTTETWFPQEIIRPKKIGDSVKYSTYFGDELAVDENDRLVKTKKSRLKKEKLFSEEIVSDGINRAVELAKSVDFAVVCVGNEPMIGARECYDRKDLQLAQHQQDLIKAVFAANPNTILLVKSSYPYSINWENDNLPAIIYTSHAGAETGNALAKVILGEYSPAGRLAQTWYSSIDELPDIKDYDIITNNSTYLYYDGTPLYSFGYGLSYGKFVYENLNVSAEKQGIRVEFDVKNISKTDSDEVAQVYFRAVNPSVKRPLKQLCAFKRQHIKTNETYHFSFVIAKKQLEFYDVTRDCFCVETGEYEFMVGSSCDNIAFSHTLKINGEKIPPRNLAVATNSINYNNASGSIMKFSPSECKHFMSGGQLVFDNVMLHGERNIQLYVSNTDGIGSINVSIDDDVFCTKVLLPVNVCPTEFQYISAKIKPFQGKHKLTFTLNNSSLMALKLY